MLSQYILLWSSHHNKVEIAQFRHIMGFVLQSWVENQGGIHLPMKISDSLFWNCVHRTLLHSSSKSAVLWIQEISVTGKEMSVPSLTIIYSVCVSSLILNISLTKTAILLLLICTFKFGIFKYLVISVRKWILGD